MTAVRVSNRQRSIRVEVRSLQTFAERALAECQRVVATKLPPAIDVLLVSDRRIAELHRRFMSISGPTDVITFQHGEIFISVDTAKRQAKQFQTSIGDELRLYLVHGLLHLHRFDDHTTRDAKRMAATQERILRRLG